MPKIIPWGEIGYITYKRTYSRKLRPNDSDSPTEEFEQTIDRVISGSVKQLKVPFTEGEQLRLKELMLDLKGIVAGRFLWQLGTKTVDKLGLASLQNCAFCVVDHPITPFTWAFDMLMLGSGVGYNIQREFVYKLPKVLKKKIKIFRLDEPDADFIVPDSREGWVKLLGKVLKSHFYSGEGFSYSTICIRGKGSPIQGFGGTASGPEDLVAGISNICHILESRRGKQLRPIDCLDIMNIIGAIVVAGNVRRSAQLAIGDYDDIEFLQAKNWETGEIPNWRAMSNNSIACDDFKKILPQFWDNYNGSGEPYGLINLGLSQVCGRIGETNYKDPDVLGYNPSLRGGTKVWTNDGIKNIETLQDTEFLVKNLNNKIVPAKCWLSSPAAPLYKITLEGGHEYFCTAEHKWAIYTPQGYVKCETPDLKPGHLLPINKSDSLTSGSLGTEDDGFFIGWLYGDGGIHIRKDNGKPQLNLIVSKKDDESNISTRLLTKLNSIKNQLSTWALRKGNKELSVSASTVFAWLDSFGVDYENKHLPSKIWSECSEDFRRGFVDGLISSDGGVESNYKNAKIRLSACERKETMLREFSELLGFYGIKNDIHYCKSKLGDKTFGRYTLSITSRENIIHFRKLFSLSVNHKQLSLMDISTLVTRSTSKYNSHFKIQSVELTDLIEPVWDIEVMDDTHCFQIAHMITGNCAEQSLAPNETCVTGDTWIPTKEGVFKIKNLVGKSIDIFNGQEWSKVTPFIANNNDTFMKLTFSDGSSLKATPYHEFSVSNPTNKTVFNKVQASNLKVGMYLPKFELPVDSESLIDEEAYTLGAFCGDGYMDSGKPVLCGNEKSHELVFDSCNTGVYGKMWKSSDRIQTMYRTRIKSERNINWADLRNKNSGLPAQIMSLNKVSILEFLAGWIDTDGSVRNKGASGEGYIICSTAKQKLEDLQILCRRAGINFASLRKMASKGSKTNYGIRKYDLWVLHIPTFECESIPTRLKIAFSFGDRYKINNAHTSSKLIDSAPRQRIVKIEYLSSTEPSYCFSEPKKHMGVFNNVLTHQCCLAEIYLPRINSLEELKEMATYLYRINKHSLAIKCHHKSTQEVVHKHMRMGIGITGYAMATKEQKSWLDPTYKFLRQYDKYYSGEHGFPESIKLTTVKPSGTLSLLAGVTPGAHPGYSRYFIRRVRMASDAPLVALCRQNGYHVEYVRNFDGTDDKGTVVVSFPCCFPEGTQIAKDTSAIDQLKTIKELQTIWSDNAVSVTIYYKPEELEGIKKWLSRNYNKSLKTVSFLLHSEHGFDQAPYEEISKEIYENMVKKVTPIMNVEVAEHEITESEECSNGVCPIK